MQIPSTRRPNATFAKFATLAALAAFAGAYAASVARLAHGPFPLEEAISILVVMGAVFPALALLLLKGVRPLAAAGSGVALVRPSQATVGPRELAATGALFLVVVGYIAGGSSAIDALLPTAPDSLAHQGLVLVKKLAVFVVLPYAVLRVGFGRTAADFGLGRDALRALRGRQGLAVAVLAIAFCAFQWFAGRGAAPLRSGEIAGTALLVGVPLSFAWVTVEAGLVEEFFFRAVLQDRLAAALRSPGAAVFVGALLFGLAHAPGYVLRGAGVVDGLGAAPGVLDAAAYAIAVPAIASFVFAVLWLRTRNLWVGMLVHGAVDALPNVADTVRAWGLG